MLNFSANDIKELSSSERVYDRGMDYYRRGLVKNFRYLPAQLLITAMVAGSEDYEVEIRLDIDGDIDTASCDCPAFLQYDGACKHIVAVLLEAIERHGTAPALRSAAATEPDKLTPMSRLQPALPPAKPGINPQLALSRMLVADLLKTNRKLASSREPLALEATLYLDPRYLHSLPSFGLKIGQQRLYVVRNIGELLEAVLYQRDLYFGKGFTFQPGLQQFPATAQPLIDLLLEAYRDEKSRHPSYYLSSSDSFRQQFTLHPSYFRRFLEIAGRLDQAFWQRNNNLPVVPIRVGHEPLPVTLRLQQGPEHPELGLETPEPVLELPFAPDIFICGDRFVIPPLSGHEALRLVLASFAKIRNQTLPLTAEDAAALVTEAAPALKASCRFEIAPEIESRLHREALTVTLWLDKAENGISAKVQFEYGTALRFNPMDPVPQEQPEKLVLRDRAAEADFLNRLTGAGFVAVEDYYRLFDEDDVYQFLRETLPGLLETATVYRSEAFDRIRIQRPPRFSGAVRLNETSDLLEVSFEMEHFPDLELQEFYTALREKKRYFRLKSGGFIPLDQPETLAAGRFLDQLGLTGPDLERTIVSLPKYRALYLDQALRDYGRERFNLNPSFKKLIQAVKEPQDIEADLPEQLSGVLRDYQKTGFKWLKTLSYYGFGGILADDMGLGKTLQVIALVGSEYPSVRRPSLVIAPTSLLYNWREEIAKFAPDLPVLVIDGPKAARDRLLESVAEQAFVITSYPQLRRDIEEMKEIRFAYCFLDEAQQIKNPETINAKSVKQIQAGRYFAVTGTPIENSLTELWSIFDFIMPGYLYSHHQFQVRFETPVMKNNDARALEDLGRHIRPFILRRLKKDVLTELPEKIETKLVAEMTDAQKKVYAAYLSQARTELESELQKNGVERSQLKILALLTRLRQICCHPALFLEDYRGGSGKMELLQEIVGDSLAGNHRILLFSQFVTMLDLIAEQLSSDGIRHCRIDGRTPAEERQRLVRAFNGGGAEVFLISLKAGGTGLNLTGADTVIHYDPWWNPAAEDQATDRAYRIGQTNSVQVFKLVTRGAIEEKIFALQQKKRELVDAVIQPGENFMTRMTLAEIRDLFAE